MTPIVLAVLAAAWLGYFALWWRHKRASLPQRADDGLARFGRSFGDMALGAVSVASAGEGSRILSVGAPLPAGHGVSIPVSVDEGMRGGYGVPLPAGHGVSIPSIWAVPRIRADLWAPPRTRGQARRRRRQVAATLAGLVFASLLAVPVFGATALAVHLTVDAMMLAFAFGSLRRRSPSAVDLADVRAIYPDRPARSDVAEPLRRVVGG